MFELAAPAQAMKNRYIAVFFAFFGGILGLHRMYLRGFNAGGSRLVFFFLALFLRWPFVLVVLTVVSIIEGMLMATMSPEEFDIKYNKKARSASAPSRTSAPATPVSPTRRRSAAWFSQAPKWIKSGTRKFRNYDMKGALEDFLEALAADPNNPSAHFNLACTYSILEDAERGFFHLEQAVACGFRESEKILTHDSLAFLRIQPAWPSFAAAGFRMVKPASLESGDDGNLLAALKRLQEQRLNGEITEADFQALKEKLLR
jgi:TM2 domain-containing membrane protein YozV